MEAKHQAVSAASVRTIQVRIPYQVIAQKLFHDDVSFFIFLLFFFKKKGSGQDRLEWVDGEQPATLLLPAFLAVPFSHTSPNLGTALGKSHERTLTVCHCSISPAWEWWFAPSTPQAPRWARPGCPWPTASSSASPPPRRWFSLAFAPPPPNLTVLCF